MSGIKVIGIGGAGGAIASYIHSKAGFSIPVVIVDLDINHQSNIPPLVHMAQEVLDSKRFFYEFMDDILLPELPTEIIALTGFTGKKTPVIMNHLQQYCNSRCIKFVVTGVTSFAFQGRKKAYESSELIAILKNLSITVYPFSNNELLATESLSSSLDDALKINYEKIYNEVIIPHYKETTSFLNCEKSFHKHDKEVIDDNGFHIAKKAPQKTLSQSPVLFSHTNKTIRTAVTIGSMICAVALGISIAAILYAFGMY